MPTGGTRPVITFIVSFIVLAISLPLIGHALFVGMNDYVIPTLMSDDFIDRQYNQSLQACAVMNNITTQECEDWLSQWEVLGVHPFARTAYHLQTSPMFPLEGNWQQLVDSQYIVVLVLISLVFALINELGGRGV